MTGRRKRLQSGFRQEYNLSASGRSEKMNVYGSLGYLDQEAYPGGFIADPSDRPPEGGLSGEEVAQDRRKLQLHPV